MIVAAAKTAPAQPELTRALDYLASWPVGQRVRVEFGDGEPIRVADVMERRMPFPRPQTDEERGVAGQRRGRRARARARPPADDDLREGTRADSDGEIRLRPGAAGYGDEDTERAAAFRDADRAAGRPGRRAASVSPASTGGRRTARTRNRSPGRRASGAIRCTPGCTRPARGRTCPVPRSSSSRARRPYPTSGTRSRATPAPATARSRCGCGRTGGSAAGQPGAARRREGG